MDRYRVSHQINAGAFGIVFEAYEKKSGNKVAVKKVNKRFYEFNQRQRNRELKALKELTHTNLITLLDFVEKGGSIYFIFEYMDFNLYEVMCSRKGVHFPMLLIQSAMRQVLLGLEFMHQSGFFHRDLKPENIMVTEGRVKIADFGQVQELKTNGKKLTQYVSTRWYRAPEVLLGYRYYSSPVDIWAVGAIAAEMMTLRPLFPGNCSLDQISRLCSVLGSPSDISFGGSWPLGKQLAAMSGMRFPKPSKGTLLTNLGSFPSVTPDSTQFIMDLLQFDSKNRPTATEALAHNFFREPEENHCSETSSYNLSSSFEANSFYSDEGLELDLSPEFSFPTEERKTDFLPKDSFDPHLREYLTEYSEDGLSAYSTKSIPYNTSRVKDIPVQAVSSLPINYLHRFNTTHSLFDSYDVSLDHINALLPKRPLSLYDIMDDYEIKAFDISRANTEPINLSDEEYQPSSPKSNLTSLDSPDFIKVLPSKSPACGLRRMSNIPSSEFTSLRRLSGNFEKLVQTSVLDQLKSPPGISKVNSSPLRHFDTPTLSHEDDSKRFIHHNATNPAYPFPVPAGNRRNSFGNILVKVKTLFHRKPLGNTPDSSHLSEG